MADIPSEVDVAGSVDAVQSPESDFLVSALFELRTALNPLIGALHILSRTSGRNDEREQRTLLATANRAGQDVLAVITAVETFLQKNHDEQHFRSQPVNLELAIESAVASNAWRLHGNPINVAVQYPPELPQFVLGDPSRIIEVLSHIVAAMLGTIVEGTLETIVSFDSESSMLVLQWHSPMLSPEYPQSLSNIQASIDWRVCQGLLPYMNGRLRCDLETASCYLELPRATHVTADEVLRERARGLDKVRVLVSDDNLSYSESFRQKLEGCGALLTTCKTEDALSVLQAASPDNEFHMLIVGARQFDTHAAYVARTMQSAPALKEVLLALLLTDEPPAYEIDHILLAGFKLFLRDKQPAKAVTELAQAWRSWSAEGLMPENTEEAVNDRPHILHVEDMALSRHVTRLILEEMGCRVEGASDGREALEKFAAQPFDLVLMDVGLPDVNGLEVTRQLREVEPSDRHTPVIGLSAHAEEIDSRNAEDAGMDEYLVKPLVEASLCQTIHKWLPEAHLNEIAS